MKRVIISSLEQARQIVGSLDEPTLLIADPHLVGALGVRYFTSIVQYLRQDNEGIRLTLGIPCHHHPSLVFTALEENVNEIYFDENHLLWPKIKALGHNRGICVKPMSEVIYGMASL